MQRRDVKLEDTHTFFSIVVPGEWTGKEREWADRFWDTYGFDYDTERCASGGVLAWPCNDEEDETKAATVLERALSEAGIEYEIFEATFETVFGEIY